uniref:Uncharacterized protein n=1 Tax=Macrostomum lignano TaxID=282301 RepID=A0A1I8G455_9PLAT
MQLRQVLPATEPSGAQAKRLQPSVKRNPSWSLPTPFTLAQTVTGAALGQVRGSRRLKIARATSRQRRWSASDSARGQSRLCRVE